MRKIARIGSLICALTYLCGCSSLKLDKFTQYLPSREPALTNRVAVDRALKLSTLAENEQPYHLILDITPPTQASSAMSGQIEIHWLNRLTYRTVIHSPGFTQTRIVNGSVVEEHNTGAFYPRWIQNFVDALIDPVPTPDTFRRLPGVVSVTEDSTPCLVAPADIADSQICLQGTEPRLASIQEFTRYISFDDYAPFGTQQIPRRLINALPSSTMLQGHVTLLEPLQPGDYALLKAIQYTPPGDKILTTLIPESDALSLLESSPHKTWPPSRANAGPVNETSTGMHLYIRTDRTGQVREAYTDPSDHYGLANPALRQALQLKFKPLIVASIPRQIETSLTLP